MVSEKYKIKIIIYFKKVIRKFNKWIEDKNKIKYIKTRN